MSEGRPDTATADDYIAALDQPRRGEVRELHDLIRETSPTSSPPWARA